MKKLMILLLLFAEATLFAQENAAQKELLKRANENYELFKTDPKRAFQEAREIEKESQNINVREAELQAIRVQCAYYKKNNDFKNLLIKADLLFQKAKQYNFLLYQTIAKRRSYEAYFYSELPNKAIQELNQGLEIINKMKDDDDRTILERGNLFVEYSNYSSLKNDYKNKLKYVRLAGREFKKIQNKKDRERLLYIHYSNLAGFYKDINQLDSAKYYAKLSHSMDTIYARNDVWFINLWVLGVAELKNQDYKKALHYFKKAEELKGYKNHLNIEGLYEDIITTHSQLQQEDSVKLYQVKKDILKLSVSESQNRSLHKLLKDKDNRSYQKYVYISGFILIVTGVFLFFVIRKNKILKKQEKASQQYLEKTFRNPSGADYSKLMKMLEKNEPTFMAYFIEVFPEFSLKIKAINPKISNSDIEFCALLKLKISTKDIAKYQFIEPQSVRNKKYRIRKKLHIPKEDDIYQFFEEL